MKTELPLAITSVEEAKAFLSALHTNGEAFHPNDNATDIDWDLPVAEQPTYLQANHLNELMNQIYQLPGNDVKPLAFDPCDYLLWLDVKFNNPKLKEAIESGLLDKYTTEYEYTIEKSADPYNEFYKLVIMTADAIVLECVYHDRQEAEDDEEVLEHWLNISEA